MRVRCGFSGFSADWVAQRQLSEPGPPGLASGKAPKSRECAKAALKLSPVQGPFCSGFESKSKAPKTPPSHGLTGFAAIKPVAKAAMVSERGRQRNCFSGGCQAGSEYRRGFNADSMRVQRVQRVQRRLGRTAAAFGTRPARACVWESAQKPRMCESGPEAQPRSRPVLLRFQERIQGPQNASIARFHGLRCYQTSSEAGDDFCALRRRKSCGWPGCKRALRNCQAANEKARKHASWRAEAAHEPATGCKAKVASWT